MVGAAQRSGIKVTVASAIILLSCSTEQLGDTLTLSDGSEITGLLGKESCSVVLVMSPEECLSCTGILETWVGLGRRGQFGVHLLLTGAPSARQAEKLTLQRVPLRGIASEGHVNSKTKAYLFDDGELIDSIVGVPEHSLILNQLTDRRKRGDSTLDRMCWWNTIEIRRKSK